MGKWTDYKAIMFEDKKGLLNKGPEFKKTSFPFNDASSTLIFTISAHIVKVLIGELFFNFEDETILAKTALKLLRRKENDSYNAKIKMPLRYRLAIQHTSAVL